MALEPGEIGSRRVKHRAPGAAEPGRATPQPIAQASPAVTRTPSGIFVSTRIRPTAVPAIVTVTSEGNSTAVIVQGRVYDAGHGQRLNNATIEWQFTLQQARTKLHRLYPSVST